MGEEGKKYSDSIGLGPIRDKMHPIVRWNRKTYGNYHWAILFCLELFDQYLIRIKINDISYAVKTLQNILNKSTELQYRMNMDFTRTIFPIECVPEYYRIFRNDIYCYRFWYTDQKPITKSWGNNDPPDWFYIFSEIRDKQIPRSVRKRSTILRETNYTQKRQKCSFGWIINQDPVLFFV